MYQLSKKISNYINKEYLRWNRMKKIVCSDFEKYLIYPFEMLYFQLLNWDKVLCITIIVMKLLSSNCDICYKCISVCIFHLTYSEKYILKTKKMTIQIYFCFLKCKLTNKRKLSLFSFKHNSYNSIFLCCVYIYSCCTYFNSSSMCIYKSTLLFVI